MKKLPRGIRNFNPGNLVISRIPWKGKIPLKKNTDGHFEQFVDMPHGIRAMIMDITNDIKKDGLNTIVKLLTEYAPSFENDLPAYINSVSNRTKLDPNEVIKPVKESITKLIKAISYHENGGDYITDEQIEKAWLLL